MDSPNSSFLSAGMRYIADSKNLHTVLKGLVEASAASAGTAMGSLFLLEPRGVLIPCVVHNLPESYLSGCSEVPLGTQCCGRAALHKAPWIVSDMWVDPLFADCRQAAMEAGIRAGFSVPVLDDDGNCLGTLASHFATPHIPSPDILERHQLFARLIAYAIERGGDTAELCTDESAAAASPAGM